ncbi:hypothetical protein [Moorena producens]
MTYIQFYYPYSLFPVPCSLKKCTSPNLELLNHSTLSPSSSNC